MGNSGAYFLGYILGVISRYGRLKTTNGLGLSGSGFCHGHSVYRYDLGGVAPVADRPRGQG